MVRKHPPPIYKYLDVDGARATLEKQTFKWTKPSQFKAKFKDDMDMTISKLFPEDVEQSLEIIKDNFITILANNDNQQLRYSDPLVTLIQECFRNNPAAVNAFQKKLQQDSVSDIYDIDHILRKSEKHVNEINKFLQGYRVLCGSKNILSECMWRDYAADGKGIALCIKPSSIVVKDSVFKLFKEVKYFDERPTLFASTLEFLNHNFFEEPWALIDRIIYSKTNQYSYESEYRCVLPLLPHEEHQDDIYEKFHAEEITGLYLGENIEDDYKLLFVKLAKQINPNISIYQISKINNESLHANDVSRDYYKI